MNKTTESPMDENFPSKEERTWSMLCHISVFSGMLIPFGHILAPLVIWLIKKDDLPLLSDQGKEVLNFQISMTLYLFISVLLCFILIGIPLLIGLIIFCIIATIIGAISANDGKKYRYPITIRFVS